MSRTFVHIPAWMKYLKHADPRWRRFFCEDHRHETGPCDLDRYDPRAPWRATRCHIEFVTTGRNVFCGCALCTGRHDRRADRRRDRHRARAESHSALREA